MKLKKEVIEFSTGFEIGVNRGIIGLSPELCVSEGYDSDIALPEDDYLDEDNRLTKEECVELADYMITQWTLFRDKYK